MTDLPLHVVLPETETTITLGWTPPVGCRGYVFTANGKRSSTLDPTRSSVKFAKPGPYTVEALGTLAQGAYPPPVVPAGVTADAWLVTQQLNQTDPSSGAGNKYSFGWAKSARPAAGYPADWQVNGYLRFADFPDECVIVNSKQFLEGFPGATTNFHLVGDDVAHRGVSPLRSDWHEGRGVWEVVCQSEGDGTDRNYHWTIASSSEIDRAATYTEEWHVRWRPDFTGYIHLNVLKDGQPWRQVIADNIRTQYDNQKPEVFVWLGAYESDGVTQTAKTLQTLDYRGRTLPEAMADKPVFGSDAHSVSTAGGTASSVVKTGTLPLGVA